MHRFRIAQGKTGKYVGIGLGFGIGLMLISGMVVRSETHTVNCAETSSSGLVRASQSGDLSEVRRMITCGENPNVLATWTQPHPDLQYPMELQAPPLVAAAWNGQVDTAQALIEAGGEVDLPDEWGFSALMTAADVGSAPMVDLLINAGADVNKVTDCSDCDQETALSIAAEYGHADVVQLLLSAGADTSHQTATGLTALELAQRDGHLQVIRILEAH